MSDQWYSNPTQFFYACRALALGKSLNQMDVIQGVRSWRLGAIVHTLRSHYVWTIVTEYRGLERIGHHRPAKTCDPSELDFPPSAQRLAVELEAVWNEGRAAVGLGAVDG